MCVPQLRQGNDEMATRLPGCAVLGGSADMPAVTRKVDHDDTFAIGELKGRAIATPCHTPDHICYFGQWTYGVDGSRSLRFTLSFPPLLCAVEGPAGSPAAVFTGDTLFGACASPLTHPPFSAVPHVRRPASFSRRLRPLQLRHAPANAHGVEHPHCQLARRHPGIRWVRDDACRVVCSRPPAVHPRFNHLPRHEYTINNLKFALSVEPDNPDIIARMAWAERCLAEGKHTVPSTVVDELACNPFMRLAQPKVQAYCGGASDPVAVIAELRARKNAFGLGSGKK